MDINEHVAPLASWTSNSGGRQATIRGLTVEQFRALPHGAKDLGGSDDGKTTCDFRFQTPRGLVAVGDYWWNESDELSVRSTSRNAIIWLRRYLKQFGVKVVQRVSPPLFRRA